MKAKGRLGCGDHEVVEFRIPRVRRAKSKLTTLNFRRAGSDIYNSLLGRVR